jgi:3-oxoacyl-[acyl-carrier-protein] synthase-3
MSAYLQAFGHYTPERVVTNAELAARLDKTPEWIENACGIRERRYAAADESIVDMAERAAKNCLGESRDVSMVILASGSGAVGFPGPAVELAHRLGLEGVPALDVPIASAGALFGLVLAMRMQANVLVVASEKMSSLLSDDPNTAILFGDGAGAALVSPQSGRWRLLDAALHSDGQYREDIKFDGSLKMNGLNVILHASRKMPAVIQEVLDRNQVSAAQVSAFLVHQANMNLLTRVAKTLGVGPEKFFSNIARYGNTSSASMLIAASEWAETNPVPGPIVFCAFGAGFHWGAVLAESV